MPLKMTIVWGWRPGEEGNTVHLVLVIPQGSTAVSLRSGVAV